MVPRSPKLAVTRDVTTTQEKEECAGFTDRTRSYRYMSMIHCIQSIEPRLGGHVVNSFE